MVIGLKVGHIVAEPLGVLGKVVGFTRDCARIEWDGREDEIVLYTDDDLKAMGVVLVDGQ